MRNLDKPPVKIRFKSNMTDSEKLEVYEGICRASRQYIVQTTEQFFKNFLKKDRFQVAAKTGIITTMPKKYNEAFIKRMGRLADMAESRGYVVKFSKWKTTKEYGWFYVREK